MHAWATTLHKAPPPATALAMTETEFSPANLGTLELFRLTQFCGFSQFSGTSFGQCAGCQTGGLGAAAAQ